MLRLKTFGGLSLQRDGAPVEGAAAQRRRLALLALLAAAGDRGMSREKILSLLWPESDPERARKSLAQAVYALRRELGSEEVVVGVSDLRLGWDGLVSDIAEFRAALASGRPQAAVELYSGPFLDGVYIDEAPEFDRWAETERGVLAHDYADAVERLAVEADRKGEHRVATGWWRRLANADPLNAKVSLGLMRALAAQGDRGAALQHYRVYEMLLRQELDLSPDPALRGFAEELRRSRPVELPPGSVSAPPPAAPASAAPPPPLDSVPATTLPRTAAVARPTGSRDHPRERQGISGMTDEYARPRPSGITAQPPPVVPLPPVVRKPFLARKSTRHGIAIGIVIGLALAGMIRVRLFRSGPAAESPTPVIAVGMIQDYTRAREGLARPLAEMLATNLARAEGLQVVSTARMYELMAQRGPITDSSAAVVGAARAAGAGELVDGALLDSAGSYRLDLRRTDLATGSLRNAYRVEGKDLFALVDAGTSALVRTLGLKGPNGTLAEVSTRSVMAYRLYEEGIRAYYNGESEAAVRLLGQSLLEDSTFAMAAYWWGRIKGDQAMLQRAVRLSSRATDRERLVIQTGWAVFANDPTSLAVAETLTVRYPTVPDGHLWLSHALKWSGDFTGAIVPLRRVIAMDSLGFRQDPRSPEAPPRCLACDATIELSNAYHMLDSLGAAERVARDWVKRQPGNFNAWANLGLILQYEGKYDEALAASQTVAALAPQVSQAFFRALVNLRADRFAPADEVFREMGQGDTASKAEGYKWLSISLRNQGRLQDALLAARQVRATERAPRRDAAPYNALFEAAVLYDLGEYRRSAALFDSISRGPRFEMATQVARNLVWTQTLRATALAAAGDTALLPAVADSIERWGRASSFGRDWRLHHHIRGLLLEARGDLEGAATEYRKSIFSPTFSYTRTQVALARVLLRLGRPREAAEICEAAMRGPFDGSNTYATQTELAEIAAAAWDAAGEKDRALVRYRQVAGNWQHADLPLQPRAERARLRMAALAGS